MTYKQIFVKSDLARGRIIFPCDYYAFCHDVSTNQINSQILGFLELHAMIFCFTVFSNIKVAEVRFLTITFVKFSEKNNFQKGHPKTI